MDGLAKVIPLPVRPPVTEARERYLIRYEEKTDVVLPSSEGKRVVRVKKTFFDGRDRLEFTVEQEIAKGQSVDAFLAEVDTVVSRFFECGCNESARLYQNEPNPS